MSFSRAFQWYHSHLDPIWPDGTFNNLALPCRWWLQNFILRHIYEKKVFTVQKFVKKANMIFQKCNIGFKTQTLMLILNLLKSCKKLMQKIINEKVTESLHFYLYFCMQKFSSCNFFVWFLALFEPSINYCVLWYPCKICEEIFFVAYISTFC